MRLSCRLGLLMTVLLGVLGSFGCVPKGQATAGPTIPDQVVRAWRIQPVRMRIYPTTAILRAADLTTLEVRLELFDEVGDSTKGVGTFHFEIYAHQRPGEPAIGQRLGTWVVPVLSLAENRAQYDPITRTYLFRLRLPAPPAAEQPVLLVATFMPAQGPRLETRALLTADGVRAEQD